MSGKPGDRPLSVRQSEPMLGRWRLVHYALLALGILMVLASWLVVGYGTARTDIAVTDVWVGETAAARAVIHGTIANRGVNGDQLLRLSFGGADRVAVVDGAGREIESLRIPADSELVLGGDTLRIEAIGLARPIRAHESRPLMLVFARAGKLRVNARVVAIQGVNLK
jgi:copper(I)-binding protein